MNPMEIAGFILDYLRVFLTAWPFVILVLGLVAFWKFNVPITSLIDRIIQLQYRDVLLTLKDVAQPKKKSIGGKKIRDDDLRSLAETGDAQAQYNLGVMHETGSGATKDLDKAVSFYQKAADQGNAEAQTRLGMLYALGRGVPQDDAKAVDWDLRAADQGNAEAQAQIGIMYADGLGVPQDDEMAYMWFNVAASRSTGEDRKRHVKFRNKLAARLSRDQLAEAQHRAREWAAAHPR